MKGSGQGVEGGRSPAPYIEKRKYMTMVRREKRDTSHKTGNAGKKLKEPRNDKDVGVRRNLKQTFSILAGRKKN